MNQQRNTCNCMPGQKQNKKIILGVTGSFGSGKTTVAASFKTYSAQVFDADKLAHECIAPKGKCYKKIIVAFGGQILKNDVTIDRRKLGSIVFGNKKLLKKLNNIIHPEVIKEIRKRLNKSKARIIVLDIPLLIESGLTKLADKLIVVTINRSEQIKRIKNRDSLCRKDILKIINSQIPLRVKERLADFVIDNSGTIEETKKQIRKIMKQLSLASGL